MGEGGFGWLYLRLSEGTDGKRKLCKSFEVRTEKRQEKSDWFVTDLMLPAMLILERLKPKNEMPSIAP